MSCGKFHFIDILALVLVIIGALNWGIQVVLEREIIMGILKLGPDIANIVYVLVAVAGIWCLFSVLPRTCRK